VRPGEAEERADHEALVRAHVAAPDEPDRERERHERPRRKQVQRGGDFVAQAIGAVRFSSAQRSA